MKLRFAASVLAAALSICATGARNTDATILGGELVIHSSYNTGVANDDDIKSRRRAELISTIGFHQRVTSGRSIYNNPDIGILEDDEKKPRHRLGNSLLNDRVRRDSHSAVLGVPDNTTVPRLLQAEAAPLCGTNGTCLPNACDCLANGDFVSYECSQVFHSLCNGYTDADGKNWTFEGCYRGHPDFPGLQEYNRNYGCPLWKCIVEGGTYGSCFCQLYHSLCQTYGDERPYADDKRALGFCAADKCCQSKTDEAGRMSCTFGEPHRVEYRHENPRCGGINATCSPSVCNCYANGLEMFACAAPLHAICIGETDSNGKQWEFEGCFRDYPDYPEYHLYERTAYCEVAKCVVDGHGTYGSCYCQMYHTLCDLFGDVRKYNFYVDAPGFCMVDACCQTKVDEGGMLSCFGVATTSSATIKNPNITTKGINEELPSSSPTMADTNTDTTGAPSAMDDVDTTATTGTSNETTVVEEPSNSGSQSLMSLHRSVGAILSFALAAI